MSPSKEISTCNEEKENQPEKKDSKEVNELLNRSSSYNQADHIAASNVNSVIEVDLVQKASALPENLLQNLNINTDSGNTDTLQSELRDEEEVQDLASFLIRRASKNSALANYFYWYLLIECEDQEHTIKQDVCCDIL